MSDTVNGSELKRRRLSREGVLRAAVEVADAGGIGALTIRSLATQLGTKPMSVYYHVANKDEILDGIVDIVFSEIELPTVGGDWRAELARRAHSARRVLRLHPWATPLLESRTHPGPATLKHHDAVLGTLRSAGFSPEMTAHAYAMLDAYIYGFAIQEASLPFEGPDGVGEVAEPIMQLMASGEYPHLIEMATSYYVQPGYDFGNEFDFGLGLILDALAATRSTAGPGNQGSRAQ